MDIEGKLFSCIHRATDWQICDDTGSFEVAPHSMDNFIEHVRSLEQFCTRILARFCLELEAPIAIGSFPNEFGLMTHSTYGVRIHEDPFNFALAVNAVCRENFVLVEAVASHLHLGILSGFWSVKSPLVLMGMPIISSKGDRLGTLAVMRNSDFASSNEHSERKFRQMVRSLTRGIESHLLV